MLYIRFPVIPGVFNLFFGVNLFNALLNCVFRSCLLYTFIASEIYYKMTKEEAPPQREAAISKQVRIKDLPFYAEPPKVTDYRFVEDDPPLGAGLVRAARLKCTDYCNAVKARLGIVNQQLEPVKEVATATEDYIRRERDLLPKAAAITVGGMGGFVLGMRRGPVTRFVYTLGGLLTATAFCYPVETMHVLRTGVAHAQRTWEDFQKAPEPETKK